jgi:TPR repeat protein
MRSLNFLVFILFTLLITRTSNATQGQLGKKKTNNQRQVNLLNELSELSPQELCKQGKLFYAMAETEANFNKKAKLYQQAQHSYEKAAKKGHIEANFNLGLMYYYGNGGIKDIGYALQRFTQAARQGHSRSQYFVGKLYSEGQGSVEEDIIEGIKWYQRAAHQGLAEAQLELGHIYNNPWRAFRNQDLAIKYYYEAAKQGSKEALNALARIESAQTSFLLGGIYYNGHGTPKNDWLAYQYYENAAKVGHQGAWRFIQQKARVGDPKAQILFGKLIFYHNPGQAIDLYKRAAQQNDPEAAFLLGKVYERRGQEKNIEEALKWYAKAAANHHKNARQRIYEIAGMGLSEGHPEAQFIIGCLDYSGPRKDKREAAVNWFKRAAIQGHLESLFQLGMICWEGEEVARSPSQAALYWKEAGRKGHIKAQYCLAKLHENGARGVEKNIHQAVYWLQLAAKGGHKEARCSLLRISRSISRRSIKTRNTNVNGHVSSQDLYRKGELFHLIALEEQNPELKSEHYQQASRFYEEAAEQGHKEAQYKLGLMYHNGTGVERDPGYALQLLTHSANQGQAHAQYELGRIYDEGQGALIQNIASAIKWYEEAAHQGLAEAQLELGHIYSNRWGTVKNIERSIYWYCKAAEQGKDVTNVLSYINSPESLFVLGNIYYDGHGTPKNDWLAYQYYENASKVGHQGAWRFIQQKARLGYPKAQILLGKLVFPHNPEQAIDLYKRAAQQNDLEAAFLLGKAHEIGQFCEKSLIKALNWYAKAAPSYYEAKQRIYEIAGMGLPKGHPEAQFIMGCLHYSDPHKDKREAANWFKKAALQEHLESLFRLGMMCLKGEGIDQSPSQAAFYWEKAGRKGHTNSQYQLGKLYITDQCNILQNWLQGIEWLKKASEQGHPEALQDLRFINDNHLHKLNEEENIVVDAEAFFKKADSFYALANQEREVNKKEELQGKAHDLYTKLAKQGYSDAQFKLGLIYRDGITVKKDLGYAKSLFIQSAEQGHIQAQYELGKIYNEGQGSIIQDKDEARKWYTLAAMHGHAEAQLELGHIYNNRWDPGKDVSQAVRWYFASAKQGNKNALNMLGMLSHSAEALFTLGEIYEYGYGIDRNNYMALYNYAEAAKAGHTEALLVLKKKAEQGDSKSQVTLGKLVYQNNPKRALGLYGEAAQKDDHEAEFLLGQEHEQGRFYEQDISKALHWYLRAASGGYYNAKQRIYEIAGMGISKGHPEAQFMMGELIKMDFQKDQKEVLPWFKKAADQQHLTSGLTEAEAKAFMQILIEGAQTGNQEAQLSFGKLLESNIFNNETIKKLKEKQKTYQVTQIKAPFELALIHMDESPIQAAHYLEKASEGGHAPAQYHLSKIYAKGARGVEKDLKKSINLLNKAAEQGHKEAQYDLGLEYIKGQSVEINDIKAVEWWLKAGYQNHKEAQLNLSLMFKLGYGVLRNQRKSWHWLQKVPSDSVRQSIFNNNMIGKVLSLKDDCLEIIEGIKKLTSLGSSPSRHYIDNASINTLQFLLNFIDRENTHSINISEVYTNATEKGDSSAQFILGILYEFGLGIRKDSERSIQWYIQSAVQGHLKAQEKLSFFINHQEDKYKIFDWYRRLLAVKEDKKEWLKLEIQEGDLSSCHHLGLMFLYGWSVDKDQKQAFDYLMNAANHKYIPSQKVVAEMYREGKVVEQSHKEALRWYRRAGKQGDAGASAAIKEMADENISAALYDLGRAHEEGWGIARDEDEAIALYSQAALQGYPQAQYAFSVKCLEGKASSREALDPIDLLTILSGEEARRSYLKFMGKSFNKKEKKKLKELQEEGLPEKGYYKAQHKLAELYETGKIIPPKTIKDTLVSYQEAIRLYEGAINSNKPVAITPLARVRSSLEKLKNLSEKDQVKLDHPEFGKLLEEIEESGRNLNPEFLYQLAFLFNEANSFSGSVENKLKNILHTFIRLPESSKRTQGIMQMLTTLTQSKEFKEGFPDKSQEETEAYRLKELSTIETSINLIRRSWSFIPLPSTLSDHFKVSTTLLHDPRIEMFNSYFKQAENDYDPDLFQRSVRKILNLFDRLMKEGYIKGESLYSEDDENFGSRETLEKLLTHNDKPNNRFAHRLIRIADIVYEQFRKDPILVASQLTQWAKRGLNCLTASEEEMNRFYIEYITNTKMDSEALTKEDRTLEMQIALTLAKLRYQLLDTLVEEKDDQRIHSVKHLEKKARWSLGLLGDAENYMDDSGYVVPLKYQKMSVEQITSKILEYYTSDFVATHITRQIDDRAIDYDKIIRRLRFQYIRAKVTSHGELDESLFRNEDYLLDHCTREEFNKHVLLLDTFNKGEKDHKEILDWDALKEKSYEKAKEQMTEEFYDGNYKGTVKGTKAVLYGMGYLEEEL